MAIDILREELVSFRQLAASLPRRRKNRPIHTSTIHRWRRPGLRGVRLDAVRIGGAWHTSREAFARFCEQMTATDQVASLPVTTSDREKGVHESVDSELAADGW